MKKWIKKLGFILRHWLFWWCVAVWIALMIGVYLVPKNSQEVKERIVYKESPECYVYGYWGHRYVYNDSVWHPFPPESCKIDTIVETYVARRLFVSGKLMDYQLLNKFREAKVETVYVFEPCPDTSSGDWYYELKLEAHKTLWIRLDTMWQAGDIVWRKR